MFRFKKSLIRIIGLALIIIPIFTPIYVSGCSDCVGAYDSYSYVELNTFPVDLNKLFLFDNLTKQAERLNQIGNGSGGWVMSPWGEHFLSRNHIEGANKWYLYSDTPIPYVAPISGKLKSYKVNNGTPAMVLGNEVIVDVRIEYNIGGYNTIKFEHLTILRSLHEQLVNRKYTFSEGEILGYGSNFYPDFWSIDFHYKYKGKDVCPYPAFSEELKVNISQNYNLQYERAKLAGVYAESKLCNNYDISVPDTIWGVWMYKSGNFDSEVNAVYDFGLPPSGITILHRNLTNSETFWKNPVNPSENLTSSVIAYYTDSSGASVPGYSKVGRSLVELQEGDEINGILRLTTTENDDWGVNTTLFARYSLELNGPNLRDDILRIQYFSSLGEAQSGFTAAGEIYYQRFTGFLTYFDLEIFVILGGVGLGLVLLGGVFLIIRRKKRKSK